MKLAEALNLRADLQKRIAELKGRLVNNAQVQEGDTPSEDPEILLKELDNDIFELQRLIKAINKTNNDTYVDNKSVTDMIAERDALGLKISTLRAFVNEASARVDRYSNKEIKILSTINVSEKQKYIDDLSKKYRLIDTKLQGINWTTDIIE